MSLGSRIASMSGWEHDTSKPNANYLRELCKALGCSADYLRTRLGRKFGIKK